MTPAGIEPVIFWFVAQHLNHCATVVPDDVMGSYIFYPGHLTAGEGHLVAIEQGGSLGPICKKLKCTLVQALRLCTGHTTHTGSRGIALLFLDHGTRRGVRGQRHTPAALYPQERPTTHCTGGWVGPRARLDRWGKSRPHWDSIFGLSSQ